MSDTYDALRAQADDYAETGSAIEAIDVYRQVLSRIMAWKPDLQNDLRDATCISPRTRRHLPACSVEPADSMKPIALKHSEQTSGTNGIASSQILIPGSAANR